MADNTHIEWTDATWQPITGCSIVSPGCTNCYAMGLAGTRLRHHPSREGLTTDSKAGPVWNGQVKFNEKWLDQPLHWKKPRRVFVCAHGDLFHEAVPDEWIDRVFAVMALAPQHTFQVLSKRSGRMREYFLNLGEEHWLPPRLQKIANFIPVRPGAEPGEPPEWPLPNVWLGVSVEDQQRADERIPDLLATPAAKRFLSCEPLLGPVDLPIGGRCRGCGHLNRCDGLACEGCGQQEFADRLDWVIVGGESGANARPCDLDWLRAISAQCRAASVARFMKQLGSAPMLHGFTGMPIKDRKGGDWSEWPDDLRVREFPEDG